MIKPGPPYEKTKLPGGIARLIEICELLRNRNTDGYLTTAQWGGILANIKDHRSLLVCKGTTCTPFTATVIGVAFDPKYPRNDLPYPGGDPYVPMFNGGKDPLMPYADFHIEHNVNNKAVESIVKYNLGTEIDMKQMRRGDMVEIGWYTRNGHGVFCWDVHLNEKKEVDCFQFLGANGGEGLAGVTIWGCRDERWLTGKSANGVRNTGTLQKAPGKTKIFVDSDDIVTTGQWLVLPGVPKGSINLDTFKARPKPSKLVYPAGKGTWTAETIRVARFWNDDPLPEPYCMKNGASSPKDAEPPGQVSAPTTPVRFFGVQRDSDAPKKVLPTQPHQEDDKPAKPTTSGRNLGLQIDPEALKKVPPKQAHQDKDKSLNRQHHVESAMQMFYRAKWIEADPGNSDDINDAKTKAAIREFQRLFMLDDDGIVGPLTWAALEKQLPACVRQPATQELLAKLYRGKKLTTDPGPPDGVINAQTRDAVVEFQKKNVLKVTGVPDADTLAKILEVIKSHEASPTQSGLEPELHALCWVGSPVAPGGSKTLQLHSRDLMIGQECPIHLIDEVSGTEAEASVKLKVEKKGEAEVVVPIPKEFGAGARLKARVTAAIADEGELEATTPAPLEVRAESTGPIAVVDGDNVYLDPPVRALPQWDPRWKNESIYKEVKWQAGGCNISSAAIILRWFAEDCNAGKIPFPTKEGGSISHNFYGLRLAESFWPNINPHGSLPVVPWAEFPKFYSVAAHYLKTGEIKRNEKGDVVEPSKHSPTWHYVRNNEKKPRSKEDWLSLIRNMLKTGPVIVGIGHPAPKGHFVVAQGVIGGALLIVDPGIVLYSAMAGGKTKIDKKTKQVTTYIDNWSGKKEGYLDGNMENAKYKDNVRMPSIWPDGPAPGEEGNGKNYNLISGQFLQDLLDNLISLTSLTYPEGAKFSDAAEKKPTDDSLEVFFKFHGNIGEKETPQDHMYVAYKVKGKSSAYFLKGRLQVDIDGAPNCYHPDDLNVLKLSQYLTVDLMAYKGALDKKSNGGADKGWYGMVTDEKTGEPIVQGPNDPCPGFYVSSTSLVDQTKKRNDPNRYVDARKIPYIAFPGQIYSARGPRFTRVGEGPTGELGDFLTVVNPNADDAHKYCHAVFADMGGGDDPHFGEGSPALAQRVHAAGVVEAKLLYIIYPHSGSGKYRIPTPEEIQQKGEAFFKEWGGMKEVNRVLPLMK